MNGGSVGRPEKPVDGAGGAVAAFARGLRQLRKDAGSPTYRDMAQSALFSSSVLSSAASGSRLPTLQVTLAFVTACGGDRELWARRWRQVSGSGGTNSGYAPRPALPDPAVRRSLPRPAQLPQRPRGFVGRLAELCSLGADVTNRVTPVVISGPVGVGKSEIALRYAHDVAAEMTDGHLYADLRVAEPTGAGADTVLAGFLRALGVTGADLPSSPHQQAGLYRSLLVERRMVVLLENVSDERQVRPLLAETERSVTIMVSRTPLYGLRDVRRIHLGVLSRPDSVAMIAAAAPENTGITADACARLAELCGDLPLALDIAARKLAARSDVDLPGLVARLTEPRRLFGWLRLGDISVRESLNSAYLRLGDRAEALLGQLARQAPGDVFAAGTGDAPDSGAEYEDELFDELVESGMLRRGEQPGSYRLDSLVRAFLHVRAQPAGRSPSWEGRTRHLAPVTGADRGGLAFSYA